MSSELRPDNLSRADMPGDAPDLPAWLRQRLEWFSNLKFGLFVHWGLYAEWGCTESWPLVASEPWARDPQLPAWVDCGYDLERFQRAYWRLNERFNPRAFDPDGWVAAARAAGMRYFNFTTKHHDGFCLFDTRTTPFRTTHPSCPFHDHPYADVTRVLFERFRAAGLALSCYFSKPDWHCADYWRPVGGGLRKEAAAGEQGAVGGAPATGATTRNPTYDPRAEPERWARFVDFTHRQILELLTGYGPIDVLWLDGGWVRPPEQDLQMDRLVAAARARQPGLIVVDRTVGGPHENVLTPEQQIPAEPLARVWETCLTVGTSFAYKPNDEYKSVRQLVALLADVASKGGNLLLGVGADKHGALPPEAVERLRGVGQWLAVHGEAIFGTRCAAEPGTGTAALPFQQNDAALEVRYTRRGDTLYAILLAKPMQQRPPATVRLRGIRPAVGSTMALLGVNEPAAWSMEGEDAVVRIPTAQLEHEPARPAWVLRCTAPDMPTNRPTRA